MPFYKITKLFTLLRVNLIQLFAIQKTKLYLGMTKYLALINSSSRSLYAFYLASRNVFNFIVKKCQV